MSDDFSIFSELDLAADGGDLAFPKLSARFVKRDPRIQQAVHERDSPNVFKNFVSAKCGNAKRVRVSPRTANSYQIERDPAYLLSPGICVG